VTGVDAWAASDEEALPALISAIDETFPPEDAVGAAPAAYEVSRRPLTPPEWDRRAILLVSLGVYVLVLLGLLVKLLSMPDPTEQIGWLMTASTGVLGPILGFYFAKPTT
jgi:hypothetical protein